MAPLALHDEPAVLIRLLPELALVLVLMAFEALRLRLREIGNHEPDSGTRLEGEGTRVARLAFDLDMPARERIPGEAMIEFDLFPRCPGMAG